MGKLMKQGSTLEGTGELGIRDAVRLKELLMEVYARGGDLSIDLGGSESIDLACVQVVCAGARSFRKAGKAFSLGGFLPEGVKGLLKDMGIDGGGCEVECRGESVWGTGEGDE